MAKQKQNLISRSQVKMSARNRGKSEDAEENDFGTPWMYPSEVVVRVWPNTYRYGNQNTFFKRPDKGIGHAAVTFRHTTHTGRIAGVYVSWWPGQSLTVGLKALKTQQGLSGGSYFLDKFL